MRNLSFLLSSSHLFFVHKGALAFLSSSLSCPLRNEVPKGGGPLYGRSPSVGRVASNSQAALQSLRELENAVVGEATGYFDGFFTGRINATLARANITDARFLNFAIETQVEYSSEFNIDAITAVVVSAIGAFGAGTDAGGKITAETAASPEALAAYTSLVLSIGEAVKSSSESSSSFQFSFERLGPGMFAFISAKATTLKDETIWGDEAITATTFVYQMISSSDDIRSTTGFIQDKILAATFLEALNSDALVVNTFTSLRLELVNRLGAGNITFDEYVVTDANYVGAIAAAQKRIDDSQFGFKSFAPRAILSEPHPSVFLPERNYAVINLAMKQKLELVDKERLELVRYFKKVEWSKCGRSRRYRFFRRLEKEIDMEIKSNPSYGLSDILVKPMKVVDHKVLRGNDYNSVDDEEF